MKKSLTTAVLFLLVFALALPGAAGAQSNTGFKDVSGTFWAKEAIDSLVQIGIVRGYEDNTFKPNNPVTREEFASLITQSFYLDLPGEDAPQSFIDVSPTRWSFTAIEASKDFLTGYYPPSGRNFFDPTGKATREDVAVALVKALNYQSDELQNPNVLRRFYDADTISPNMREYVALAVEKKLMVGNPDGSFRPNDPVTRAESATLLFKVIKGAAGDSQQQLHLQVDAPATVSSPTFYITGDVTKGAQVSINNKEVEIVQGRFQVGYRLDEEGTYTYTVSARMPGGKTQTVTKTVKFEKDGPQLEVKGIPEVSDKQTITVSWKVSDENDPYPVVYVNDKQQSSYTSSTSVELEPGDNTIRVRAENEFGKSTEVVKRVLFQSGGPALTVHNVPETTSKESVTVSWTVQDKNDSSPKVYVNDKEMSSYQNSTVLALQEGSNTITVKAVNKLGQTTQVVKTVVFSGDAPTLQVDPLPETVNKSSVTVSWQVSDKNDGSPKVYVNDVLQSSYSNSTVLTLVQGANTIKVKAVNKLGKTTEVTRTVTFASQGPVLQVNPIPSSTTKRTVSISWSVSDQNDGSPKVFVNGEEQSYYSSKTIVLNPGANNIQIKATNKFGQIAEQSLDIAFEPSAPVLVLGYAPETTQSASLTLSWTVTDENDGNPKVYVNDALMSGYGNSKTVALVPGANTFKIVAGNSYGKTTEITYTVTYNPAP